MLERPVCTTEPPVDMPEASIPVKSAFVALIVRALSPVTTREEYRDASVIAPKFASEIVSSDETFRLIVSTSVVVSSVVLAIELASVEAFSSNDTLSAAPVASAKWQKYGYKHTKKDQ